MCDCLRRCWDLFLLLCAGVVSQDTGGGILAQAQTAELPYNPVSHQKHSKTLLMCVYTFTTGLCRDANLSKPLTFSVNS